MQETRVRSLIWEDPTCRGATKPMCLDYWACALSPCSTRKATTVSSPRSPKLEKKSRAIWAECSEQGFTLTSCVSLCKSISQSSFYKPQLYFLYHHMRNNIHLCLGNRKGSGSDSLSFVSILPLLHCLFRLWGLDQWNMVACVLQGQGSRGSGFERGCDFA